MKYFTYHHNELYAEDVNLKQLAAEFGTPVYVYSRAAIEEQWQNFQIALANYPHKLCYAVKANSNIGILNLLAQQGAYFDIVSGGELARVLAAGVSPAKIIFSGVGKQITEIEHALTVGIYCFNVESKDEILRINTLAKQKSIRAPISLRINPEIQIPTHPFITTGAKENKFGIPFDNAIDSFLLAKSLPHLQIIGIACHIGSQITTVEPFLKATERLQALIAELKQHGIAINHIDLGGGLGVNYHQEEVAKIETYIENILDKLSGSSLELILAPGRRIVAEAGILLTRVEYLKHQGNKNFAIVDAGINDFIRPALYDAWHGILPITLHTHGEAQLYDVVGPVCETSDVLAKTRHLYLENGDLLAVYTAGAYGFSMSSNYNSRPRPAEILVDKNQTHVIREREKLTDLFAHEKLIK